MGESCKCCKVCCYSTPYATIFMLSVTLVGLVGFLSSAVYSIITVSETDLFTNHTVILAPVIGGLAGTTILPLFCATIMAYCVTGYIRDELYHPFVKACVGSTCSTVVMIWTFVYFLLWLLMGVALTLIMALYLLLVWACPKFQPEVSESSTMSRDCFSYNIAVTGDGMSTLQVCTSGLQDLCAQGEKIGLSLSISLAFSMVVIIGFVALLTVQSANYVSARESSKRSYRPGGNY